MLESVAASLTLRFVLSQVIVKTQAMFRGSWQRVSPAPVILSHLIVWVVLLLTQSILAHFILTIYLNQRQPSEFRTAFNGTD